MAMRSERTWKPRDPAEAFFSVEMRPLFMTIGEGNTGLQEIN
jgi:hypothetical protein